MDLGLEGFTNFVSNIFQEYGWYFFGLSLILYYLYDKFGRYYIEKYRSQKFQQEYAAKYHKNPDLFLEHQKAQQKFVDKLQANYDQKNNEYKQKLKEKEERRQNEYLEKYSNTTTGNKLGTKSEPDKKNAFKPEYNPLMGSPSTSNYRPPKKRACSGGGCGKQ